ncbi:hypothetical protein GCM10027051_26570 [Niabella terrae]
MRHFLILFLMLTAFACNKHVKGWVYDPDATFYQKGPYQLHFEDLSKDLNPDTKRRLVETFFKVYPLLAADFNTQTTKEVRFKIDPAYEGVAATSGDIVRYDPDWFKKNPEDIDVVTHEVMHIVQHYGKSVGPWWCTEGVADYVREVYGVNNASAKWNLHLPREGENYDNGYRVTARFLLWIEKKVKKGFVTTLDAALRDHSYTAEIWVSQTGKSPAALWQDYIKNPTL